MAKTHTDGWVGAQKYYEKKKKKQAEAKHKSGDRNATYDYRIKLHEKLDERYRVLESIGKGSFGQVVKAFDERESKPVAIKIIKNKEAFRIQAKSEMDLLKLLNRHDPGDQWSIVRMKHTFMHHGHTCIVFELLSINLYQLLRRTSFQGVSLNLVRKFARQILKVRMVAGAMCVACCVAAGCCSFGAHTTIPSLAPTDACILVT